MPAKKSEDSVKGKKSYQDLKKGIEKFRGESGITARKLIKPLRKVKEKIKSGATVAKGFADEATEDLVKSIEKGLGMEGKLLKKKLTSTEGSFRKGGSVMCRGNRLARGKKTKLL